MPGSWIEGGLVCLNTNQMQPMWPVGNHMNERAKFMHVFQISEEAFNRLALLPICVDVEGRVYCMIGQVTFIGHATTVARELMEVRDADVAAWMRIQSHDVQVQMTWQHPQLYGMGQPVP